MNIGVVTSNRADYGILVPLLRRLQEDEEIALYLLVTGAHLSYGYGYTVNEIETDGFPIAAKIPILTEGNASIDISSAIANALIGFAKWFADNPLDFVIVLGDRTEMLGVCTAAMIEKIPIAHICGGELTAGAVDDSVRHAITKMSSLHFTATEVYRKRVIQLGEHPKTVYNVGALTTENILKESLMDRDNLLDNLGIYTDKPLVVVTYHPETRENNDVEAQVNILLSAMEQRKDYFYLITKSNNDEGGQLINERLAKYVEKNKKTSLLVDSLGRKRYHSAVKVAAFVLGNSSSGISEAPVLGTPTVNLGSRQQGRIMAESIVNCRLETEDILRAMDQASVMVHVPTEMYGDGSASVSMLSILKHMAGHVSLKKGFYDIPFEIA